MEHTCKTCEYCIKGEMPFKNEVYKYTICELTHVLIDPDKSYCEYHNKDISKEDICYNCRYYGGLNDWGLYCSKHYHHLGNFNDKPCDDFEKKDT